MQSQQDLLLGMKSAFNELLETLLIAYAKTKVQINFLHTKYKPLAINIKWESNKGPLIILASGRPAKNTGEGVM